MAATTAMASFAGGRSGLTKKPSVFSTKGIAGRFVKNTLGRESKTDNSIPVVPTGVTDMTLVEEDDKCMCMCLMDGIVKGYNLDESGTLDPSFSFNPSPFDTYGAKPQAIACKGRYMFTSSSAPSLSVWERTAFAEQYGHEDYRRPQARPPLELVTQFVKPETVTKNLHLSNTVQRIEESLRRDRVRKHVQDVPRGAGKYAITFNP